MADPLPKIDIDALTGTADDFSDIPGNIGGDLSLLIDGQRMQLDSMMRVPEYLLEHGPALTATEMAQRLSHSFSITIPATEACRKAIEDWTAEMIKAGLYRRRPSRGWRRHVRRQKAACRR